jgi:hypothetical protein
LSNDGFCPLEYCCVTRLGSVCTHVSRRIGGGGRKGDLSRFIEEAVRSYILERAAEQAKAATAGMSETGVTDLIDEAVQWAGEH